MTAIVGGVGDHFGRGRCGGWLRHEWGPSLRPRDSSFQLPRGSPVNDTEGLVEEDPQGPQGVPAFRELVEPIAQ
jgi:hypothetical protein